jgi:DNA-binding response OmpR family regulator
MTGTSKTLEVSVPGVLRGSPHDRFHSGRIQFGRGSPAALKGTVSTLIVAPPGSTGARVGALLPASMTSICKAVDCRDALAQIRRGGIAVVVCERDLPDGTWEEVLEGIAAQPTPPLLIVTSRLADKRLWAEVLNRGGHDVLAQPFDIMEVQRVATLARDRWLRTLEERAAASSSVAGDE